MHKFEGKLLAQALVKYLAGLLMVGALLFLPSGTLDYMNAWILIIALFVPIFIAGVVMLISAPDPLRKRLDNKEQEPVQKRVVAMSGMIFLTSFILAGLDYRFGWSHLPSWVIWTATVVLVLAYLLYVEVMRENAYLFRTVKVQENQKVVDTGLYGIVRHPMYSTTILLFLAMPLVLGSIMSFTVMLAYIPIINSRIKHEERLLTHELDGYKAYKQKVIYKVVPFIW